MNRRRCTVEVKNKNKIKRRRKRRRNVCPGLLDEWFYKLSKRLCCLSGGEGSGGGSLLEPSPGGLWVEDFTTGTTSHPVRHHRIRYSHVSDIYSSTLAGRPGLDCLEEENIIVDK